MNEVDNEKAILEQAPDFDNQMKILEEEHEELVKRRKWIILVIGILLLIVLIFVLSYSHFYFYHEYHHINKKNCEYVNLKINGSKVPNLNVTEGKDCVPVYNIDYYNNQNPTFNIDLYGNRSFLFNKTNQKNEDGKCLLNCDYNKDGWPDYNIDINGDGKVDLNIDNNNDGICDLNCDINLDTIADANIDINDDGIADINITDNKGNAKYNVDYKNNRIPVFNIKEGNNVKNPVTNVADNASCEKNCDIDGDGFPDYNIALKEDGMLLNELIHKSTEKTTFDDSRTTDWKCYTDLASKDCKNKNETTKNKYINIDINGDGIADINLSLDGGVTIDNEIGKLVNGQKQNVDTNNDGFPDANIDINNDNIADINITQDNKCIKNCDTNKDGIADYLIGIKDIVVSIYNLNIDVDYDGTCDINCDSNYDLHPDYNIDINNDNIADINIDFNLDKVADFNLDTNEDYVADQNMDAYGIGECNFNCNGQNLVNSSSICERNCDTNNDGWPDKNVDINNDGICDFNCLDNSNLDKDNNYYLDKEYTSPGILNITGENESNLYILNPLDIKSSGIEPGWTGRYLLEMKNDTNFAVKYRIVWEKVTNEFTDINNLEYKITRSNTKYLDNLKAPRKSITLKDNVTIRANSSAVFVMDINFKETGMNQNIDSGKTFKGQLKIEVIN